MDKLFPWWSQDLKIMGLVSSLFKLLSSKLILVHASILSMNDEL